MPAAKTKADLLNVTEKEFAKLQALLDRVPAEIALEPDSEAAGTTIKDIVGHRAHWITLFLGWYRDGADGKTVELPAPGYKWNDLKRFNADLRHAQRNLNWPDARALLDANHQDLVDFISRLDDTELYAAPMKGGNNHWPTGRWAEAAGASHFRSAAKYIRARLKGPRSVS